MENETPQEAAPPAKTVEERLKSLEAILTGHCLMLEDYFTQLLSMGLRSGYVDKKILLDFVTKLIDEEKNGHPNTNQN